ncbi:carbohydrate ABC transporter permease [Virgibacillus pantothenticus]|uniref:carbohydrate ABC transporter permease n=1 Tax=Virgibacillus pantothenticus TaxID=1473 RepID=UPI00147D5445|nr:carbohydrate ABC transporter permease [Virgibacillus pantothenticus]
MELKRTPNQTPEEFVSILVKERASHRSTKKMFHSILKHTLLILVAITMLLPFFWMVSTSLKTSNNVFTIPPQWIPNPIEVGNYADVFKAVPFFRYIMNTVGYTIAVTFFEVMVSIMVAYGFSRFNFKFKKPLFMFLLLTIMIPGEITIVPGYIFWAKLGEFFGTSFINTYVPLILPAIGGQAVHVFFMTQYFRTIPKDFAEAAYINGAGNWKILWRIYFPMSIPAILTITISSFMGTWNAFLGPLIYLNDMNKFTIQVGLAMFQGMFDVNWPLLMAATTISILPMIVLFFSLQKYFIPSNKQDGVK